jgi:hypothetical protein
MLRAHSKFWQLHHDCISRDDFSEAPNEEFHHRDFSKTRKKWGFQPIENHIFEKFTGFLRQNQTNSKSLNEFVNR